MDPVCHTLTGAVMGHAGLAKRSALGMGTLMIAANLPDIDVAVFATDALPMAVRRGWTHGVLAQALLPPLLAATMVGWDRLRRRRSSSDPPARFGALTLLSYAGVLSHVFLDFLNSYGIRLLMPFSERWFYGDALYIVDPLIYVALAGGIILVYGRKRDGRSQPERSAQIGLVLASAYVGGMLLSHALARIEVARGLARAGLAPSTRFMVTPVLGNPFEREVFVDMGTRYERGFVQFRPMPHFRPAGFGIDTNLRDPVVVEALRHPRAQQFMQWSRFPYAAVQSTAEGRRVWLNDYRYSSNAFIGWSSMSVDVD